MVRLRKAITIMLKVRAFLRREATSKIAHSVTVFAPALADWIWITIIITMIIHMIMTTVIAIPIAIAMTMVITIIPIPMPNTRMGRNRCVAANVQPSKRMAENRDSA